MIMPLDIKPIPHPQIRQPLHVAIYEHPHGMDVRVFASEDQALGWRTRIAQEWWSHAFDDDPPPADESGAEYFERMLERDEFFSIQMCDLEVGGEAPTDPTVPAPHAKGGGASC